MVDEINNIIIATVQSHSGVPYPQFLGNLMTVVWASLFCSTYVIARRAVRKKSYDFKAWQILWLTLMVSLYGWVGSRLQFAPSEWKDEMPVVGMLLAAAIAVAPTLTTKYNNPLAKLFHRVVWPLLVACLSWVLTGELGAGSSAGRVVLAARADVYYFLLLHSCLQLHNPARHEGFSDLEPGQ